MDVRERLARLVLHNVSAATYAARKLRQGMALELKLEPTATGHLELIAFHQGRLLGKVEPIPREYIGWIRTCTDNRCIVDSLPVAEEDHMLKLLLVRLERGEPIQTPTPQPAAEIRPPEPEPELEPEPEPELIVEPEPDPLPAIRRPVELPMLSAELRYVPAHYGESPRQPSALRRHGLKWVLFAGFVVITAIAASGAHYLNSPCGRLWAYAGNVSECRLTQDGSLHFETTTPNANGFCNPTVAQLLPEVKLVRATLRSSASPVLVTCRLSK